MITSIQKEKYRLHGWDDEKIYFWDDEKKKEWSVSDRGNYTTNCLRYALNILKGRKQNKHCINQLYF